MPNIRVLLIQNTITHYNLPIYNILGRESNIDLTIAHYGSALVNEEKSFAEILLHFRKVGSLVISKENIKLNTVDNIKTNIFDKTDLSSKYNNGIFNQSENIEETNFKIPILAEDILQIKEQKKVKTIKLEEEPNQDYFNDENINNRVSNSLSNDKDITKFKEGLENIINKNSEINYTNSIKTLFENTDYKENSEVDLKLKENNNEN